MKYLVLVGILISFAGVASYIKEMLKGRAKPNKVSWIIWGISPTIAGIAMAIEEDLWIALPTLIAGIMPCGYSNFNAKKGILLESF